MAFKHMDELICNNDLLSDGSGAACITAIWAKKGSDHYLSIANVGDAQAVLAVKESKDNLVSKAMCTKHRVFNTHEMQRVLAAGAKIVDNINELQMENSQYVMHPTDDSKIINMTRSLGDKDMRVCGVISEPDIHSMVLSHHDLFLVMGSDGIWDFFKDIDILNRTNTLLHAQMKRETKHVDAEDVCIDLLSQLEDSLENGLSDDTTVQLLIFQIPS